MQQLDSLVIISTVYSVNYCQLCAACRFCALHLSFFHSRETRGLYNRGAPGIYSSLGEPGFLVWNFCCSQRLTYLYVNCFYLLRLVLRFRFWIWNLNKPLRSEEIQGKEKLGIGTSPFVYKSLISCIVFGRRPITARITPAPEQPLYFKV